MPYWNIHRSPARGRKRQYLSPESDTEPGPFGHHSTQLHHKITLGSVTVARGHGTPLTIIPTSDYNRPTSKVKRKFSDDQLEPGLGSSPCQGSTPIGTHTPPTAITGPEQQTTCEHLIRRSENARGLNKGTTPLSVKQKPSQSAAPLVAYMSKECGHTPQKIRPHDTPKMKLDDVPGIKGTTKSVDVKVGPQKRKYHNRPRKGRTHKRIVTPERIIAALAEARRAAIALELELARDSESNHHIKIPAAPPVQSGIKKVELRSCLSHEKSKTHGETEKIKRQVEWNPTAMMHTYPVQ
ncbi:hypothetical protein BGX38DRAFT_1236238 [Terfezia claveryi]|nr:hypothetical protein BGX38DRAFT_1236238 [Terfezia claveryi]